MYTVQLPFSKKGNAALIEKACREKARFDKPLSMCENNLSIHAKLANHQFCADLNNLADSIWEVSQYMHDTKGRAAGAGWVTLKSV